MFKVFVNEFKPIMHYSKHYCTFLMRKLQFLTVGFRKVYFESNSRLPFPKFMVSTVSIFISQNLRFYKNVELMAESCVWIASYAEGKGRILVATKNIYPNQTVLTDSALLRFRIYISKNVKRLHKMLLY